MLMVTYEEGFDTGEPGSVGDAAITGPGLVFWAALIVMALTGLVTVIWWIVDGVLSASLAPAAATARRSPRACCWPSPPRRWG